MHARFQMFSLWMETDLSLTSNSSNDDCLSLHYSPLSFVKSAHFLITDVTTKKSKKMARDNCELHQDLPINKLDIFLLMFCFLLMCDNQIFKIYQFHMALTKIIIC